MPLLLIILAVLVVGALTAALVWLAGARPGALADQALADPQSGSPFEGLAEGPVSTGDIRGLRFDQVLRGYRMDQVDDVLDRLADELALRDGEIARLRGEHAGAGPADAEHPSTSHASLRPDPTTHPRVTTGPLEVSEIVRPSRGSSLWSRPDRRSDDTTS